MLPILIKEGIVILIAGAMFVAGSINIANLPSQSKQKNNIHSQNQQKVLYTAEEQIKQIEIDFKRFRSEYIKEHMEENAITKNELNDLKNDSLFHYFNETTKFRFVTDKAVKKMRETLPKYLQETMSNDVSKEAVIYEYLTNKFFVNFK